MRSTDGCATWANRTPPLAAPISGRGIAVDPGDSNTVIAVFGGDFGGGQVWVTTDGGDSWTDRSAGLPDNPMQAVVYDGNRLLVGGGQLFGSENVGLYQSTDLGATWTPLHDGTWPVLVVDAIAVVPDELAEAFQGANNGGVLSSTDGGTTWQIESAPPTRYSAVRFAPDGTLYAISAGPSTVAQEGLYRRENNGSWTPLGPDQGPLYESDLDTMRFSVNNPNLILLGGADFGVAGFEGTIWRSTDAGQSWTKVYELGDFH